MKLLPFRCLSAVIVILLAFTCVHRTLAHSGHPRLEISVERMNPGGVVDIRGVEFDYEESITLYLERPGIVIELGQVIADVEGIFIHTIVLPIDLPAGAYNIRGVTEHHDVWSPALTVEGPAVSSEGGGQGPRDEDDGLLAPMPTYAPGVIPGGVSQSIVEPSSQEASDSSPNWLIFALSVLSLLAVFVFFRLRVVRKA